MRTRCAINHPTVAVSRGTRSLNFENKTASQQLHRIECCRRHPTTSLTSFLCIAQPLSLSFGAENDEKWPKRSPKEGRLQRFETLVPCCMEWCVFGAFQNIELQQSCAMCWCCEFQNFICFEYVCVFFTIDRAPRAKSFADIFSADHHILTGKVCRGYIIDTLWWCRNCAQFGFKSSNKNKGCSGHKDEYAAIPPSVSKKKQEQA